MEPLLNFNKSMLGILMVVLFACSTTAQKQEAQDENDGQVKVRISRDVDGEEQTFEKTYSSEEEMQNDEQFQEFLSKNGMPDFEFFEGSDPVELGDDFSHQFLFNLNDNDQAFGFLKSDSTMQSFAFNSKEIVEHMREMELRILEQMKNSGTFAYHSDDESSFGTTPDQGNANMKEDRKVIEMKALEISDDVAGMGKKAEVKPGDKLELNGLSCTPNPSPDGSFHLKFDTSKKGELSVSIYNDSGKTIYSRYFDEYEGTFSERIDLSKQKKGNYLLEIQLDNKRLTRKITINE